MNDAERLGAPRVGPPGYAELWDGDSRHSDRQGNRITFREWAGLMTCKNYKIVKQEYVGDYLISTVWLGLDHSFGSGPPLIFETMVFNSSKPPPPPFPDAEFGSPEFDEWSKNYPETTSASGIDCERYTTEQQAIEGHERMVEKVRLIVSAFEEKGEEADERDRADTRDQSRE